MKANKGIKINHNTTSLENKQSGVNLATMCFFATPHMYCAFSVIICVCMCMCTFLTKWSSPCIYYFEI